MINIRWWHRIQLPDGSFTPGEVKHGPDGGDWPTTRFGLPEDLSGKKVLDVGAWDGFFSFEAEKRGASYVLATDISVSEGGNWGGTIGFFEARRLLNSDVDFSFLDITDISSLRQGVDLNEPFDLVMCFGVLYHIPTVEGINRALMHLALLSNGTILIETASIADRSAEPKISFLPGHASDPTNYYYPNPAYVEHELQKYGFKCKVIYDMGSRFTMRATR